MIEPNPVSDKVIAPIRSRHSPYQFAARPVEPEKLVVLFEAARWAASAFNEQPWRYIVARASDGADFAKMLGCLVEANQAWAKHVPVLMLSFAKKTFTKNNKPNRVRLHDLGAASAQLTLQAESMGLHVHQMSGIDFDAIASTYQIPDDFEPVAALAIGYEGNNPDLDPAIAARDNRDRPRKPAEEVFFASAWQKPFDPAKPSDSSKPSA